MAKLTTAERQGLIEKVLDDCREQGYNYMEFMLDCVRETAQRWDDSDLMSWFGEPETIRAEIKEI